jgi:hypothetical protein
MSESKTVERVIITEALPGQVLSFMRFPMAIRLNLEGGGTGDVPIDPAQQVRINFPVRVVDIQCFERTITLGENQVVLERCEGGGGIYAPQHDFYVLSAAHTYTGEVVGEVR